MEWGHFGKVAVGGTKRTLCCFVLVLGHSRAMYARFFLDMTLESFLRGHVLAFEALGGVPRSLLYDNLKSVVLELGLPPASAHLAPARGPPQSAGC